jgi:hypothetical protein
MNEPWASDFRALREHTRQDAPSLERTTSLVLASATNPETEKEKPMTLLKRRPALAVGIAIALIAILTPVAYAVMNKVFLSIDRDKSEEEIEEDVRQQLEAAGISPTKVEAEKRGDGWLKIGIRSDDDPRALASDLDIDVRGTGSPGAPSGVEVGLEGQMRIEIAVECELSPAQLEALTDLVGSDEFVAPVRADQSDAQVAAGMRAVLEKHGYRSAQVTVDGATARVTVTAPPS